MKPHPGIVTVLWSITVTSLRCLNCVNLSEECSNESQVFRFKTKTWLIISPTQRVCISHKFPCLLLVRKQSLLINIYLYLFILSIQREKKDTCSRLPCLWTTKVKNVWLSSPHATQFVKTVKEPLAKPTKAESGRFSGCGIKPRGSGAGEIVPAGRDQGRRDKAHSNGLVVTH